MVNNINAMNTINNAIKITNTITYTMTNINAITNAIGMKQHTTGIACNIQIMNMVRDLLVMDFLIECFCQVQF